MKENVWFWKLRKGLNFDVHSFMDRGQYFLLWHCSLFYIATFPIYVISLLHFSIFSCALLLYQNPQTHKPIHSIWISSIFLPDLRRPKVYERQTMNTPCIQLYRIAMNRSGNYLAKRMSVPLFVFSISQIVRLQFIYIDSIDTYLLTCLRIIWCVRRCLCLCLWMREFQSDIFVFTFLQTRWAWA